jgi:hypothetical protein
MEALAPVLLDDLVLLDELPAVARVVADPERVRTRAATRPETAESSSAPTGVLNSSCS